MVASINLNDQFGWYAGKVSNELTNNMLSSERLSELSFLDAFP